MCGDDCKPTRFYTRSAAAGIGSAAKGMIDIFIRQLLFTARRAVFDGQIKCGPVRRGRRHFNKFSREVHANPNSVFCKTRFAGVLCEMIYRLTHIHGYMTFIYEQLTMIIGILFF